MPLPYQPVGMSSIYKPSTGWYAADVQQASAPHPAPTGSRQKLVDAAIVLIREKGYASTSLDDLCTKAGLSKGAFFHYFKSKDDLAVASANYWSESTGAFFAAAPYHTRSDPLERVLGYLEFRKAILAGKLPEITCLVGTMVQEVYASHPNIARACEDSIRAHAAALEVDIAAAMRRHRIRARWTAESLALHTQAVLQGSFILAKAKGGAAVAIESIEHLRRYIELLFKSRRRTPRTGRR
ncbi:MAG TPA: TetR/AcrR family transcriptional regulator [Steroidobacteraceae bacterium]|nr:TetR/AcrR family transcriptional regulator [Steroidobacteraceae bacterium]